jgi:hypothetical protein
MLKMVKVFLFLFLLSTSSYAEVIYLTCQVSGVQRTVYGAQQLNPPQATLNVMIEDEGARKYVDGDGPADFAFGMLHPAKSPYKSQDISDKFVWRMVLLNTETNTETTLTINRMSGAISLYTSYPRTVSSRDVSGTCQKLDVNKKKF